jgi:serine/threonine protein phosphatase PrpC
MTSAKQACETLVQDALDGGGTDNITVIVGTLIGEKS